MSVPSDDCDGDIDESGAVGESTWYADNDGDDYGDATATTLACTEPLGYVSDNTDCDDTNDLVSPEDTEILNGLDDDCNGNVDHISLADADAKLIGEAAGDYAGWSLSGAGDADGDGFDDLLIGAFGNDASGSDAGAVNLFYGGGF